MLSPVKNAEAEPMLACAETAARVVETRKGRSSELRTMNMSACEEVQEKQEQAYSRLPMASSLEYLGLHRQRPTQALKNY